MALNYARLSRELEERIKEDRALNRINPYASSDEDAIRRDQEKDINSLLRPSYIRDIEKIIHIPYFNRYSDKTQVFSLYKNDDISRRIIHIQLVSRISRNIGRLLGLNNDLIEAIALGHDIGHTPFGHGGESILKEIYHEKTGRYFNHNVHSVRVLDRLVNRNISLQTLDGVLCHNGEMELKRYVPDKLESFEEFDRKVEECYRDEKNIEKLIPSTLEGCVVRISDIIAYLGKDRQDAIKLNLIEDENIFSNLEIGNTNAEIINNITVNLVENSYGKDFLSLDENYYRALSIGKKENYRYIYEVGSVTREYFDVIKPMMKKMYERFVKDVETGNRDSLIYNHHVKYLKEVNRYYESEREYEKEDANDIAADYIASMTDDYFIDAFHFLFPESSLEVKYRGYFNKDRKLK